VSDKPRRDDHRRRRGFPEEVGAKEARKIRSRKEKDRGVWFGLGMFGLIGWAVAIPTLIGVAIGIWIDRTWPSRYSWTLTFLMVGVITGCITAWYWIKREGRH
jgi:ATP synthase protein I